MISIAICDDDKDQIKLLHDYLSKYREVHQNIECKITTFDSSLELLSCVEESGGFDIYMLDIFMPGFLGTQAAQQLRQHGEKGEIIFITSSRDHALEAFGVDAYQYLVKPYTEKALFTVMDKVLNRFTIERRHFINIKTTQGFVRVFTRDIAYTESSRNNYQLIHLNNKETIEVRMTSAELFELLETTNVFVRCGVSINLNLKYVRQITKENIIFDTGDRVAYPYRMYQKLKEQFLSFKINEDN